MEPHEREDAEAGFTLIELIIVVAIIAVLIAIMIPSLLQAKVPAQDRQAQNLLRNSLTAAKAVETAEGAMPSRSSLAAEELGVVFVAPSVAAPASSRSVSVGSGVVGSTWYVVLASHSTSGRCFALLEQPSSEPQFQRVDNAPACRADQFDSVTGWADAWP